MNAKELLRAHELRTAAELPTSRDLLTAAVAGYRKAPLEEAPLYHMFITRLQEAVGGPLSLRPESELERRLLTTMLLRGIVCENPMTLTPRAESCLQPRL
jgi:hypothetical protein